MNQKHCKFCGKIIDTDSKYCAHCGGNVENLTPIEQAQSLVLKDTPKVENDTPKEKYVADTTSTDKYFTIGLVTFLISVFWVLINRFVENAYEYNEIWKPINIITVSAIPILCTIFTKKQSYRIVLGIMAGMTILYYVFVFYIEK